MFLDNLRICIEITLSLNFEISYSFAYKTYIDWYRKNQKFILFFSVDILITLNKKNQLQLNRIRILCADFTMSIVF